MKKKIPDTNTEMEMNFQPDDSFKITVIVNIRSRGENISDCIKSIRNQTFQNFEVFLCNNGTEELPPDLAQGDDRFFIVNRNGDSDCRNTAIAKADGKYISFIDGHDRMKRDFLENLYDGVHDTQSDIAVCGYCYYFPKKRRKKGKLKPTIFQPSDNKIFNRGQALYLLLPDRPIRYFLWNKLFKKELFTENGIVIPNMYYEDVITCTRLFYYAEKVITLEDANYIYTRPDKVYDKQFVTVRHINDYIRTVALIRMFLEEKKCYEIFRKPFLSYQKQVYRSMFGLTMRTAKTSELGFSKNFQSAKQTLKFYVSCSKEEILNTNISEDIIK